MSITDHTTDHRVQLGQRTHILSSTPETLGKLVDRILIEWPSLLGSIIRVVRSREDSEHSSFASDTRIVVLVESW